MIDTKELPVNRLFSMRIEQISKLSDLSARLGKDLSAIVREAIDEYYNRHIDEAQKVAEN